MAQLQQHCSNVVHFEAVKDCVDQLETPVVENLAETFKALSDPTRLRILYNLSKRELCVCDLAQILGMTQSAISHQLRYLRNLRLVRNRRDGNTVYYRHDDAHTMGLLQMAVDHASHVQISKEEKSHEHA
ncbi:ArsR/SmtB family transcription factor [Alicyclobacillus dauci]|uniref:Metalloregulator ArsR/SmtB family transcription factor n=1 Tax=Alicyclobacillus dauci TaxID=1475485 RepID=A0ABY6Z5J6_9BACL|nr:metalloregulator ArsR/SmtB family transcription factor [Alicyclobacillus dauci]WAH38149.1 metalloregulator ArsR/SmtB family transcription factor [Alicyclobacillus dauci]